MSIAQALCKLWCHLFNKLQRQATSCDEVICNCCKKAKPAEHLCYIQEDIKAFNDNKKNEKNLFVDYDFECSQSTLYPDDDCAFLHESTHCVMQTTCVTCQNVTDLYKACDNCGVRQQVFTEDVVNQFRNYLVDPAVNGNSTK